MQLDGLILRAGGWARKPVGSPGGRKFPRVGLPFRSVPAPGRGNLQANSEVGSSVPAKNGSAGGTRLVIVESPAKAKTIAGYLGAGYIVESSIGHIRDLPEQGRRHPGEVQGRAVGAPRASTSTTSSSRSTSSTPTRRRRSRKLKQLLKDADELYLATDEDREGEAIAWHLREVLKPKVPVHRMVFHEITQQAIRDAVANPARPRTCAWSTPRRPGASSTGSTATRSARSCGRRSSRACRPAACSRSRPGWWWSASGSAWRSPPPTTGTCRRCSTPAGRGAPAGLHRAR